MVRSVRIFGRAFMDSIPAYRTSCLIRSKGDITRAAINFLYSSDRNFKFNISVFRFNGMLRVISDIFSTSTIGIVGLTATRGDQRCLVLFHYNGSRSNVVEQFFRYFRGDVRNNLQRRVSLVGSVCLMLTSL